MQREAAPSSEQVEQLEQDVGVVDAIYITVSAGETMQPQEQVIAHAGRGLEGDRYLLGRGYYSQREYPREGGRHLTLIEAEVLDDLQREHNITLPPNESRRNLVTRGIALNDLLDREFTIGSIRCEGVGLCEPCVYLEELTGKPVLKPLVHRGGLRAKILSSGTISLGDEVRAVS